MCELMHDCRWITCAYEWRVNLVTLFFLKLSDNLQQNDGISIRHFVHLKNWGSIWTNHSLSECVTDFIRIQSSLMIAKVNHNFTEHLLPCDTYCAFVCAHCTVCTVWNDRQLPALPQPLKLIWSSEAERRETERNVSSIPPGLNSVLDFCLFPLLFAESEWCFLHT